MLNYDERIGIVAVYHGKKRNCLHGISESNDCIYYAHGKFFNNRWHIPKSYIREAKRIYKTVKIIKL